MRILLADDNDVNQVYMRETLRRLGHEVVVAVNGREALEALALEVFHLVFMDVRMPEMDGLEAARAVREGRVHGVPQDLPIVALTAYALTGDRERFLERGMDDYLAKPVDPTELARVLGRWGEGGKAPEEPVPAGATASLDSVLSRLGDFLKKLPAASVWRLVTLALEELEPGVERIAGAVEGGDAKAVAWEAHSLRGSWTTMYGPESRMVALAQELERLAKAEDLGRSPELVAELRREVPRLRELLEGEKRRAGY